MPGDEEIAPPLADQAHRLRRGLGTSGELMLAILPTATMLAVMGLVEMLSTQRLLFASLASSAFLIYLDPTHVTNTVRTLSISHVSAALLGWSAYLLIGPGYLSAGTAMVATIAITILARAVHPPAVSTAMSFGLRAGDTSDLALFLLALAILGALIVLQRSALWTLTQMLRRRTARAGRADPP